jgi:hypothetical protein
MIFFSSYVVIRKYFIKQSKYNALLLIGFAAIIALRAISDLLYGTFNAPIENINHYIATSAMVLAPIILISATWSIILHKPAQITQFFTTMGISWVLLFFVIWFQVDYLGLIIQSFCILLIMLISILGLATKQKSALWVIIAMMFYALIIKSTALPIPMNPIDIEHYLMTLCILSLGKAVGSQYKYIF